MITKFIEATDATQFNWGKFLVGRFEGQEWQRPSEVSGVPENWPGEVRSLLRTVGWSRNNIIVMDLQTGEGAIVEPHGSARADLNDKHQIWVCPMFEPFLVWLYKQDLTDLSKLPSLVNLGDVPTALSGYRRTRKENREDVR